MSSLKELNEKLNLNIRGYRELNNVKIIDTDSGKFVIKKNTADDNLYNYLTSKNFNYILSKKKIDNYDLFPYVDEISMPDDEKARLNNEKLAKDKKKGKIIIIIGVVLVIASFVVL